MEEEEARIEEAMRKKEVERFIEQNPDIVRIFFGNTVPSEEEVLLFANQELGKYQEGLKMQEEVNHMKGENENDDEDVVLEKKKKELLESRAGAEIDKFRVFPEGQEPGVRVHQAAAERRRGRGDGEADHQDEHLSRGGALDGRWGLRNRILSIFVNFGEEKKQPFSRISILSPLKIGGERRKKNPFFCVTPVDAAES